MKNLLIFLTIISVLNGCSAPGTNYEIEPEFDTYCKEYGFALLTHRLAIGRNDIEYPDNLEFRFTVLRQYGDKRNPTIGTLPKVQLLYNNSTKTLHPIESQFEIIESDDPIVKTMYEFSYLFDTSLVKPDFFSIQFLDNVDLCERLIIDYEIDSHFNWPILM